MRMANLRHDLTPLRYAGQAYDVEDNDVRGQQRHKYFGTITEKQVLV